MLPSSAAGDSNLPARRPSARVWLVLYLFLSGLSGFLEIGLLVFALRSTLPLVNVPLFALAYQGGALLSYPIKLPYAAYFFSGIAGAACFLSFPDSPLVASLGILLAATALQHARDLAGKRCQTTTLRKRVARVIGFLVAPWLSAGMIAAISIIAVTMAAVTRLSDSSAQQSEHTARPRASLLALTMVVHQSHYFSYFCFLPWVFLNVLALPPALVGPAFALGWVSYCLTPLLFRRLPPVPVLIWGHLLVCAALCAMCIWTERLVPVLLAWFFSGFGGGTVYCLRDLNSMRGPEATDLDAWENIGHVFGAALALTLVLAWGNPKYAFASAAVLALCTAALGRQATKSPTSHEVSR